MPSPVGIKNISGEQTKAKEEIEDESQRISYKQLQLDIQRSLLPLFS